MKSILKDLDRKYVEEIVSVNFKVMKNVRIVSECYEEERRNQQSIQSLLEKEAAIKSQLSAKEALDSKQQEKQKKLQEKRDELNKLLAAELKKEQEKKAINENERISIEKHNKMLQEIQDKANFLLKPYHEYMGLEIQMAQKPEPSLRLLFSGTTPDKRCMVKISLKSMKIIKCVPMLKNLPALESHLRETNDFAGLITRLHTLFHKTLLSSKSE